MYNRIGLPPLICSFISSFFFLSSYQTLTIFIEFISGTVGPRKLKPGTYVDNGCMYRVYRNMAAAAKLSIYWSIFLSNFQFKFVFLL